MNSTLPLRVFWSVVFSFVLGTIVHAQHITTEFETGLFFFGSNEVRIPNEGGTTFDMTDVIKREAAPFIRLRLNVEFGEKKQHVIRALYAPLERTGDGSLKEETFFVSNFFQPDAETRGTYRFSTYRLTYRYNFINSDRWTVGAGAAVLVRDAKVELTQSGMTRTDTDLGVVPLLHLLVERKFENAVKVIFDVESLVGPQGRATDAELSLGYGLSERITVKGGYRVIEGGADVGQVYNFAWINFFQGGVGFHF